MCVTRQTDFEEIQNGTPVEVYKDNKKDLAYFDSKYSKIDLHSEETFEKRGKTELKNE